MKMQPTNRHNPCPLCEDVTGKCRHTEIGVLCMTLADGENVPGWRYNGQTRDGLWGRYTEDTRNWSITEQREFEEKQRLNQEARERYIKRQREQALDVEARDRAIRAIRDYVGLNSRHRQDLRDRGLTDAQIESGLYFSVDKGQQVPVGTPSNLPGIKNGLIATGGAGFACVIFDDLGRAIAWQIRVDNVQSGNKYRWAKNPHLPNGELPLGITQPNEIKRPIPGLCESPLKSRIAAYRLGQTMIGAAGGLFTSSPQQLKQYLGNATECDLYPDAGDLLNRQVMGRWSAVIKMLQSWGVKVNIAWWGQVAKDSPDCDELTHQTIRYLCADDWLRDASKLRWQYESQQEIDKTQSLTYPVNLALNQRYLGDITDKIPQSGIVVVKSPKNTGKSVFTKQLIQRVSQQGYSVVSIVPRINLGREQSEKWGLQFINESIRIRILNDEGHAIDIEFRDVPPWRRAEIWRKRQEYLNSRTWDEVPETDKINLCWDSILKLADRDFSKTVLILDECEQGLNHLLSSSTCKNRRQQILATFENIAQKSQLIIGLDADATDVTVDYLKALKPDGDVFVVVNSYQPNHWNCNVYRDRQFVYEAIKTAMALGQKIAIASDSQRECEALEKMLIKAFPTHKIDRIDSKTTAADEGKFAVRHINNYIETTQPHALIYSPSLGTGVSIDTEYFDKVFGVFYGSINPSDARQMLARVRQNQDRIIWCNSYAQNSGCRSFDWRVICSRMFQYHKSFIMDVLMVEALQKATEYSNDADLAPQIVEALQAMMGNGGQWQNPHITALAKFQARSNYHKSRLRDRLMEELEAVGHSVVYFEDNAENQIEKEAIKEAKEEIKRDEAAAIAEAEDIPIERAEALSHNHNLTPKGRAQVTKAFLKHELPDVELTPNFVYKAVTKNRHWLNAIKLHWAFNNAEKQQERDVKRWKAHLKNVLDCGISYLADIKCFSPKLQLIKESGLFDLIDLSDPAKEYSIELPEVHQFMQWCLQNRYRFLNTFNLNIDEHTEPIKFINHLLEKFNLKIKRTKKAKRPDGKRVRIYKINRELLFDRDRLMVLEALDRAWILAKEKELEALDIETRAIIDAETNGVTAETGLEMPPEEREMASDNTEFNRILAIEDNTQSQNVESVIYDWHEMPNMNINAKIEKAIAIAKTFGRDAVKKAFERCQEVYESWQGSYRDFHLTIPFEVIW